MTSSTTLPAGIAVTTSIAAGTVWPQHAEGIVVATTLTAGSPGTNLNHIEGIVVSTAITAGDTGSSLNHAESIVLR